ncbi:MAG: hypothetical protein PVI26_05990 [Chitinispirillia bacterium]
MARDFSDCHRSDDNVTYTTNSDLTHSAFYWDEDWNLLSKWGSGPLMEHSYDDCPYWEGGGNTTLKFYRLYW